MKARYLLVGILVTAIAGASISFLGSDKTQDSQSQVESKSDDWMYEFVEPNNSIDPQKIYTFQCEIRIDRPEALTTVCADFGFGVWDLKWGKWDAFGGYGEGIYRENDCNPNCAEGTISETPAQVVLTDLTFDGFRYFFNTAKVRFNDKEYLEDEYEFVWDIASFYREVPDMRSEKIYED